jgi:hypothetical protein
MCCQSRTGFVNPCAHLWHRAAPRRKVFVLPEYRRLPIGAAIME